jgi:CRISPR/Cas system CSM-associated protein Csm4 (group 5 of RAMP superfamily)
MALYWFCSTKPVRTHDLQEEERTRSKIYLVLGRGIPEGDTVYIMSRTGEGNAILWNATTGVGYSAKDERCPLKDIAMLVSSPSVLTVFT